MIELTKKQTKFVLERLGLLPIVELFIQVNANREVCVGQPLEKKEATRLACMARKTRHNKYKTNFVYGLTSLEGVQLFFRPISVNDEQLKFITKTYNKGMVYVTYDM